MKVDHRKENNRLLYSAILIAKILLAPIIKNKNFLTNVVLLLIVPSIINAYWINFEEYISISKIYKYGIRIKNGVSFPFILFIPFGFAYIVSTIHLVFNYFNSKLCTLFKVSVYCVLIMLFSINVFLLLNFNTMVSPSIIQMIIETNTNETSEFLETYLFNRKSCYSYIIILITIGYLLYSEKKKRRTIENKYVIASFLIIGGYLFQRSITPTLSFINLFKCQNLSEVEIWYTTFPVNTNILSNCIYSTYVIQLSKQEMKKAIDCTIAIKEKIELMDSLNIILIIGESYSKSHSNLYGYSHITNPLLQEQVNSGNLFVFSDVISSYNSTSLVLRNMFSVNSIMDNEIWTDYPAFTVLFRRAGYNVYLWDNQRTFGKAAVDDFSISSYLFNDRIVKNIYSAYNNEVFTYDGQLVTDFWNRVKLSENRNLIIFHLMGQHIMPYKRYPQNKKFCVFTKDSIKRVDIDDRRKTQIAYYDNATLYNDWVVYTIMNHYRNDNAVIIYFSDHGEEVYDFRDSYGRTHEKEKTPEILKYQYEIPFMIWCSNKYKETHPKVVSNISLAKDKPFMNDNVSQILMGFVGMSTHYYKPERDLISSQYKPYSHRNVQDTINYDKKRYRLNNK